jgi:hypothetical protein
MNYKSIDITVNPKPGCKRSKRFSVLVLEPCVNTFLESVRPGGNYTINPSFFS